MRKIFVITLCLMLIFSTGCASDLEKTESSSVDYGSVSDEPYKEDVENTSQPDLYNIEYNGKPYVEINGGKAEFTSSEMTTKNFKKYSELDRLGRCGTAFVCVSKEDMPTEKRGSIGMVKPSGWHTARYDDVIPDRYLYNRCHLVAYSISGTLADERNLITGTRYMNIDGMCDQEERIRDYMRQTGNHVMYRVTPIFKDDELVARGVHMEAKSVEDDGLEFNEYAFNVQPGIVIDYATGESRRENEKQTSSSKTGKEIFILNTNTGKFHHKSCRYAKSNNIEETNLTKEELIRQGYKPCGVCFN